MNGGGLNPSTTTTTTFCSIGGGLAHSNHSTFRNLHIFAWDYGVDYSDINPPSSGGIGSGTQNTVIDGCHMSINKTCVYMTPQNDGGQIFNQSIVNCNLQKDQDSADGSPIVWIDSNGGASTNVTGISLVNNLIFSNVTDDSKHSGTAQSNQYGVQIGTCQTVSIIGGQISQVGTLAGHDGTANVCISGVPDSVIIEGVNLNAIYYGANDGNSTGSAGSHASQYALLIPGDPVYVQVNNCSMIGFAGTPVSVTGSPGNVYITNCVGYNDQNTHLNGGVAPLSALSAATCSTHYFGPSLFTWSNSTPVTVHVFGVSYTASSGIIYLPSPYDTFSMSSAPLVFSWIGK
jgi:hypothetical protein